jgi:hypothetical protein
MELFTGQEEGRSWKNVCKYGHGKEVALPEKLYSQQQVNYQPDL